MLLDTHCHINMMVKDTFDTLLLPYDYQLAHEIILQAEEAKVTIIFNVGTSLIESYNCIELSRKFKNIYAVIGIHPNDLTHTWQEDITELRKQIVANPDAKIIGIGECGLDFHYPDYNKQRQYDGFNAQIELSLEHNLPLVIHTRDAGSETLRCLERFKSDNLRGIIHCFSGDIALAYDALNFGFMLGIGGIITYPKNQALRDCIKAIGLDALVLETDAPYLPPQTLRGKQNHPKNIMLIAEYIAELLGTDLDTVAAKTTANVKKIFTL